MTINTFTFKFVSEMLAQVETKHTQLPK